MNPELDGVDHINIYLKSKTELGRFLSNFTKCEISTEDGNFSSIEAYWYWLKNPPNRDILRTTHGAYAKKLGRELGADYAFEEDEVFIEKIKKAMRLKIKSNKKFLIEFGNSSLPFVHYYCFGDKVIMVEKYKWIIEEWERLRILTKDWMKNS